MLYEKLRHCTHTVTILIYPHIESVEEKEKNYGSGSAMYWYKWRAHTHDKRGKNVCYMH